MELAPPGAAAFVICDHTIEFLFRDAKQLTGLQDCQARSAAKLRFHFKARLSAVHFAKLAARQTISQTGQPFSRARVKRRGFKQHLIDRIFDHLAAWGSLDKCSAAYEELCNYGTIGELAA